MSHTFAEAPNDSTSPKKPTAHSFSKIGNQSNYPTVSTPRTPFSHIPTLKCSPTSSLESHSITIHAQTVIINNYSTTGSKNGGTTIGNDMEHPKHSSWNSGQAPAFSTSTQAMPPQDLSALHSSSRPQCPHPFSSLRRRSHRRQSMPVRGHNWNNCLHHRDFSRIVQAQGRALPVY